MLKAVEKLSFATLAGEKKNRKKQQAKTIDWSFSTIRSTLGNHKFVNMDDIDIYIYIYTHTNVMDINFHIHPTRKHTA